MLSNEAIAIAACATSSLAGLPQVASCWEKGNSAHLRWTSLGLRIVSSLLWIVYSAKIQNVYMHVGSTISLVFEIVLAVAKARHARGAAVAP